MSVERSQSRSGFTLVELLVVIAIIGVLVALLLPAVQAAREAARRMSCGNNMKQLGLALHNYHDTYDTFPMDAVYVGNPKGTQAMGAPWTAPDGGIGHQRMYTWCTLILPFMEQQPLHDRINFSTVGYNQPIASGANSNPNEVVPLQSIQLEAYLCPSDLNFSGPEQYHGFAVTSYAGNAGWDRFRRSFGEQRIAGPFSHFDAIRMADFSDGQSNTILLGEVTVGGYCCRPGPTGETRWQGGSGKIRSVRQSRVARALLITPASYDHNHAWTLAAGQGELLRADGSPGRIWAPFARSPYLLTPIYYDHYAMNVEWPGAGSMHPGGAQFTLGDASTRFIPETIAVGGRDPFGRNGNVWCAAHSYMGNTQGIREAQVVWP